MKFKKKKIKCLYQCFPQNAVKCPELQSYHETGVWAVDVDVISWSSSGGAATVTSQYVLTGSLKVKGPAVKGVVVRVAKDGTHTWFCRGTKTKRE